MKKAFILAASMVRFGKYPDRSVASLGREAVSTVLADSGVAPGDIEAVFWEDRAGSTSQRSYIRTLVADMRATFESRGLGDVVVKHRGVVGIRQDVIECDYYAFLAGDPIAIAAFHGEYMRQYSWAEMTLALLV